MNNTSKILFGAAIGGAIGWFIGAVVAEYIVLKEEGQFGEEPWTSDTEAEPWLDGTENDPIDPNADKKTFKRPEKMSNTKKNYAQIFKEQGKPELAALAAKYAGEETPGPEVDMMVEDELVEEVEFEKVEPDIQIITAKEFASEEEYETVSLNYFDDDVVTDEDDKPIDLSELETMIGTDALVSFTSSDVVYVRNNPNQVIYEITRLNKSYAAPVRRSRRTAPLSRPVKKEEDYGEQDT